MSLSNPLLHDDSLPRFDAIRPEHIGPAIDELLQQANAALERTVDDATPVDYEVMSAVLDVATERLGRAWSAVSHLNAVADTPELRATYTAQLPAITDFRTRLSSDERLFARYRALHERSQGMPLKDESES